MPILSPRPDESFWPPSSLAGRMRHLDFASSCLLDSWYDPIRRNLYVLFHGGWYRYDGVPEAFVNEMLRASSKGSYFTSRIQPYYPFHRGPNNVWTLQFDDSAPTQTSTEKGQAAVPLVGDHSFADSEKTQRPNCVRLKTQSDIIKEFFFDIVEKNLWFQYPDGQWYHVSNVNHNLLKSISKTQHFLQKFEFLRLNYPFNRVSGLGYVDGGQTVCRDAFVDDTSMGMDNGASIGLQEEFEKLLAEATRSLSLASSSAAKTSFQQLKQFVEARVENAKRLRCEIKDPFFFFDVPDNFNNLPCCAKVIKLLTLSLLSVRHPSEVLKSDLTESRTATRCLFPFFEGVHMTMSGDDSIALAIGFDLVIKRQPNPFPRNYYREPETIYQVIRDYSTFSTQHYCFFRNPDAKQRISSESDYAPLFSYLPPESKPYVLRLLLETDSTIELVVSPSLKTKKGSCRPLGSNVYKIQLCYDTDPYEMLITLFHELAHALRPRIETNEHHGRFWKLTYSNILINGYFIFPETMRNRIDGMISKPLYTE